MFIFIIPSLFFGWALGANDAANVFGPPVSSKLIKLRYAIVLSSIFIIVGALTQGQNGMETMKAISSGSLASNSIAVLAAAITMTIMINLRIPVSSSQAIIGSITGLNLITNTDLNWPMLLKVVLAWVGTPLGGFFFGFVLYRFIKPFYKKIKSPIIQDRVLKILVVLIGCYGSYALGANNVANITGVFAVHTGMMNALLIGSLSIAAGVLTYSRKTMLSFGKGISNYDYFSSSVVILAESLTVWVYAFIGIPVSTSQAVIGATIGTGIGAGNVQINKKQILKIVIAWVNTPISSGLIAVALFLLLKSFGLAI
ncbi:MAG TPA: inorganic phosphate transporter [Thermotogota bacterium]|nr:inorganic phosphate transporter [Thermotogota bacterium]